MLLLCIEIFDLLPPVVLLDLAVDAADAPAVDQGGPVFEDVELGLELAEDEDFMA